MSKLIIRKPGMLNPPILVTEEANCVEVYEGGELVAVMHKVLSDSTWGVTVKGDSDWEECLYQLGYVPGMDGMVRG